MKIIKNQNTLDITDGMNEIIPTRVRRIESMIIHESVNDEITKSNNNLFCSYRIFIAFLLGACTLISYAQRQALNFTIFCMVNENGKYESLSDEILNNSCRNLYFNTSQEKIKPGPFYWNKDIQGLILGSFYWGYSFQIFGGFFAAKIGTKFTLALSVIISSVTTLLIPFAADSNGNYRLLIILRVFTGLAQGLIYPATLPFIIKWSTKSEKSILWSIITAGSCLGILLSTVLSGPVCSTGYWELNFIISGVLGFIWLLPWLKFSENSPEKSSKINSIELAYLRSNSNNLKSIEGESPLDWPLIEILSSKSVWSIVITNILSDFTLYGILSVFPSFLYEIYGVDILSNSYICAGEYIFMFISTVLFGILSNFMIQKRKWSTIKARKLCNTFGMLVPSLLFPIISFIDCTKRNLAIGFLMIVIIVYVSIYYFNINKINFKAGGSTGAYISSGFILNAADIAGSYSGIVFGLSNSLGSLCGIIAPFIAHSITTDSTLIQWRICFTLFSFILFIASLIFLIFSKGNLETWAMTNKTEINLTNKNENPNDLFNSIENILVGNDSLENIANNNNFNNVVLVRDNKANDLISNVKNV